MSEKKTKSGKPRKEPFGRPTKYKPEYCKMIVEYFRNEDCAFFELFADSINVHIDTMLEWCRVHPNFSESYKKAKQIQKAKLAQNALNNEKNPTMSIFLLKAAHGMKEVTHIQQETKEVKSFGDMYGD